ncbi:MAG: hypothetical protein GY696_37450 [Gammaproteobacteria bacterium]|nr:hypothetical protein [Gammaproteobacteria bacterium]
MRKLDPINKAIVTLIENGEDASVPARDMKTKIAIKAIGDIQDAMDLGDYGSVQEQVDEVNASISVLEDNIALLETEVKQREANKCLERLTALWTTNEERDTEEAGLSSFLASRQKHLAFLSDEWAAVKKYVSKSLDAQFDTCLWECQEWLEEMSAIATVATAASERDSSITGTTSHQLSSDRIGNQDLKCPIYHHGAVQAIRT